MQTIRKRLSILLAASSIGAILLITLFVNLAINKKFDEYMRDIQNRRHERITEYFAELYKLEGSFKLTSGRELVHEAHMSNYCLTLYDENKNIIWGMDPSSLNLDDMGSDRGVYTTNTYDILVDNKAVGYVEIGQYSAVLLTEEDESFKAAINSSIILSGLMTLVIVIGVSLYFSRQFSSPIKEAVNMSVNLSKGNFNQSSKLKSNIEELESLINSTNLLAEKLKYQEQLRSRLVGDISHEIRTPLNVLQNNLEAMIDGIYPITEERLSYLNDEVIRFGKLLNNLDTLKEFEAESIKLDFKKLKLDELIAEVCRDYYPLAIDKGIKLNWYIAPNNDYTVLGDKDKLKQVFINLLSNGIKFSSSDSAIDIMVFSEEKEIVVQVKDNGIGITKEDIPFIFERLYRGDKSRQEIEGSGIGLSIVKSILEHHFARIEVESEMDKGTTFTIHIPKTSA